MSMSQYIRSRARYAVLFTMPVLALSVAACSESDTRGPGATEPSRLDVAPAAVQPGVHRQYGVPQKLGNGHVRTYVVLDAGNGQTPLEVGVALSEDAMEGLPAPVAMSGHDAMKGGHQSENIILLDMPAQNPTPYQFVELDWNAAGHEPPGIYDIPHFDFHFYRVPVAVRNSILPEDPEYAAKAANLPGSDFRAPFYVDMGTAAGAPAAAVTVPLMGLHWIDVRSPELQGMAGNPEGYRPFTKTFIVGSWDGEFIFDEPMITRGYLLAKRTATAADVRDEIIPLPTAERYAPAGFYPASYRITYDAQAKEYRVALTQLTTRD